MDVIERLKYNKKWERECDFVASFEDFSDLNRAEKTIMSILEVLGISFDSFPMDKAIELCNHSKSIGRWNKDKIILEFLEKLKKEDSALYKKVQRFIS